MNKNNKIEAYLKRPPVILGTSSPLVVKPLKLHEKNVLPSHKPVKLKSQPKRKHKRKSKAKRRANKIKKLKKGSIHSLVRFPASKNYYFASAMTAD
jgi:hypothetical protein